MSLWPNGWMNKTPRGTKVDLGTGHIVLDGDPAPLPRKGTAAPSFRPMSLVAAVAHISYCRALVHLFCEKYVGLTVTRLSFKLTLTT